MDEDYLKELGWISLTTIVISTIVSAVVSFICSVN